MFKLLKRNKRSLRNIVCCSNSHNPCILKLRFYQKKKAACRLFVHAIATWFEFFREIFKLLKRNKRSLRNIVCCSNSHNPCILKLRFYQKKKAACRLFVHAIATCKVQSCEFELELELAELGHFRQTRT